MTLARCNGPAVRPRNPVPIWVVGKCVESCAVPTPLDRVKPVRATLPPSTAPGRRAVAADGAATCLVLIVEALAIPWDRDRPCAHVKGWGWWNCEGCPSNDRRRLRRTREGQHENAHRDESSQTGDRTI